MSSGFGISDEGMRQMFSGLYRSESVLETNRPAKEIQTMVIKETEYDPGVCSFLTLGWLAPKSSQPHSTPDLNSRMGDGPILLMSFTGHDIGGFRHSDNVLVTKDGYEILTKFSSDLESLIIRKHNVKASMMGKLVRKAVNYPEVE